MDREIHDPLRARSLTPVQQASSFAFAGRAKKLTSPLHLTSPTPSDRMIPGMRKTHHNDAHTTRARRASDPPSPTSTRTEGITSSSLDPSKLNQQPAAIPPTDSSDPTSQTLRSAGDPTSTDSAYLLDAGTPHEPASHPTVAETGALAKSGPGPMSGQLKRVEGGERKNGKGIIKLGSFGGEGLAAKPAAGSFGSPNEGEGGGGSAIAD